MNLILDNFKKIFYHNEKLIGKFIEAWDVRMKKVQDIGCNFTGKLVNKEEVDALIKSIEELFKDLELSKYKIFTNFEIFVKNPDLAENKLSNFTDKLKTTIKAYADLVEMKDIEKWYIYCGNNFDKIKKEDLKSNPNVTSFFSLFFDEIMYKMLIMKLFIRFGNDRDTGSRDYREKDYEEAGKFYQRVFLGSSDYSKLTSFSINFNHEKFNKFIDSCHLLNLNICFNYFCNEELQRFFSKYKYFIKNEVKNFKLEITKSDADKAK